MDDEEEYLVCAIVGDPLSAPQEGSTREHYCSRCAREVWMSRRMMAYQAFNGDAIVLCAKCSVEMEPEDTEVQALPGDQITEPELRLLQEYLRRAYGDGTAT